MGRGRDLGGTLEGVACNIRVIVSVPGPRSTCPKRQINPITKTYPSLSLLCTDMTHLSQPLSMAWHVAGIHHMTPSHGGYSYCSIWSHILCLMLLSSPPPAISSYDLTQNTFFIEKNKKRNKGKMLLRVVHNTIVHLKTNKGGEIRPWNCFSIMKWIALFFLLWKVCISLSRGKKKKDPEQNQCVTISMRRQCGAVPSAQVVAALMRHGCWLFSVQWNSIISGQSQGPAHDPEDQNHRDWACL